MAFGPAEALTVLLATESFLLAAVSVALGMHAPDRGWVSMFTPPRALVPVTLLLTTFSVVVGAVTAWFKLYHGDHLLPWPEVLVAAATLIAALGQGLVTVILSLAMIEAN